MKWIIMILGVLTNASASICITFAVKHSRPLFSLTDPMAILSNWPLLAGLAMYAMTFVLYAAALTKWPLHVAHPMLTAGAIATVAVASSFIFDELLNWVDVVGILFVILGVVLITA